MVRALLGLTTLAQGRFLGHRAGRLLGLASAGGRPGATSSIVARSEEGGTGSRKSRPGGYAQARAHEHLPRHSTFWRRSGSDFGSGWARRGAKRPRNDHELLHNFSSTAALLVRNLNNDSNCLRPCVSPGKWACVCSGRIASPLIRSPRQPDRYHRRRPLTARAPAGSNVDSPRHPMPFPARGRALIAALRFSRPPFNSWVIR
jgi:hypothetical protein